MKIHIGDTMSIGKGSIYSTSIRQNINTRTSEESEMVGVHDIMLWFYGSNISYNPRDIALKQTYLRKIKVQFSWKRTVGPPAEKEPGTSI